LAAAIERKSLTLASTGTAGIDRISAGNFFSNSAIGGAGFGQYR
jgi:hypothetical protein